MSDAQSMREKLEVKATLEVMTDKPQPPPSLSAFTHSLFPAHINSPMEHPPILWRCHFNTSFQLHRRKELGNVYGPGLDVVPSPSLGLHRLSQ